ncbi:hypothetical protein U9M48_029861 [Paspalum notatum var. saurae]|uniref:Uncharacterized protein n=1 Tax=Paspalum notatum var. saurae TaxID=547442 RepID=A0AAQ3TZQ1_PASNO
MAAPLSPTVRCTIDFLSGLHVSRPFAPFYRVRLPSSLPLYRVTAFSSPPSSSREPLSATHPSSFSPHCVLHYVTFPAGGGGASYLFLPPLSPFGTRLRPRFAVADRAPRFPIHPRLADADRACCRRPCLLPAQKPPPAPSPPARARRLLDIPAPSSKTDCCFCLAHPACYRRTAASLWMW